MPIDYEKRKDGIAIITMNRPEKHNALTKADLTRLTEVFYELRTDPSVLVAIITGAGNRSFTTGMDLSLVGELHPDHYKDVPQGLLMNMVPYMKGIDIWKPIIAAVNGHAIALGACMLLGTDIRLATPNATYALNEVLFADLADGGALPRLPRQIPYVHAMKILLTGETINAQEMLRIGLINEIVPQEKLMPRALEIAEHLVNKCDKYSVQVTKQAVIRGMDVGLSQALLEEALFKEMLENRHGLKNPMMEKYADKFRK
jgi:E-phenylitaconyl-CoA hydratase